MRAGKSISLQCPPLWLFPSTVSAAWALLALHMPGRYDQCLVPHHPRTANTNVTHSGTSFFKAPRPPLPQSGVQNPTNEQPGPFPRAGPLWVHRHLKLPKRSHRLAQAGGIRVPWVHPILNWGCQGKMKGYLQLNHRQKKRPAALESSWTLLQLAFQRRSSDIYKMSICQPCVELWRHSHW